MAMPMFSSTSGPKPGKMVKKLSNNYSSYMLYDISTVSERLGNLTLAKCNPDEEYVKIDSSSGGTEEPEELYASVRNTYVISDRMSCSYCDEDFNSQKEQREHYRSDWHRFNLKMKLKGLSCVTENEFEEITADISSLSGSDTSSDSDSGREDDKLFRISKNFKTKGLSVHIVGEQRTSSGTDSDSDVPSDVKARRYPKIFFSTQDHDVVSLYRCVLYHKSEAVSFDYIREKAKDLPNHMKWAIFMCGGGHFASAIFDGFKVVCHKTFHRYIVRAKRGTAQSSRDSQGNAPKSAGASIRRHNEAALTQEIQELISSWESHIQTCDLIFIRAPSFNSKIFFKGKSGKIAPFSKSDLRIRSIPFQTKRPTFNEVKRVHEILVSLECYGKEEDIQGFVPKSPKRQLSSETGKLEVVEDELPVLVKKKTGQSDSHETESYQQSCQSSVLNDLKYHSGFNNESPIEGRIISDKDLFEYEYNRVQKIKKARKKKKVPTATLR